MVILCIGVLTFLSYLLAAARIPKDASLFRQESVYRNAIFAEVEMRELEDIVQKKIYKVMNSPNCTRTFLCDFRWTCGFACTLHHIVYCASISMMHDRPLILLDRGWSYAPGGWVTLFEPISGTCHNVSVNNAPTWNGTPLDQHAKIMHYMINYIKYDPMETIPKEIRSRLTRFHGNPVAWWIGQLIKYVLRPKPELVKFKTEVINRIGFNQPVVGIQVRRTDKLIREATAYDIRAYMAKVNEYFDDRGYLSRRVYIATDDPGVVTEVRKLYPHYAILHDQRLTAGAGVKERYSIEGLKAIVTDLEILSKCDYVVCTFSSNVCRAVYEYMHVIHVKPSCYSLDEKYRFH